MPLCYPLAVEGERFPFVAPQARAFLVGDDGDGALERGRVDDATLFAAICHGTAHLERLCFDLLHLTGADVDGPVSLTGGGARNPWWNQLRCDVLGVPVRVPADAEGALGMAVLAAGPSTATSPARRSGWSGSTARSTPIRGAAPRWPRTTSRSSTPCSRRGWLDPHARRARPHAATSAP